MKGTNRKQPRCAALTGEIGAPVACAIYQNRPSPCRDFGVNMVDGQIRADAADRERCNRARAAWGLPPLVFDASAPPLESPVPEML